MKFLKEASYELSKLMGSFFFISESLVGGIRKFLLE